MMSPRTSQPVPLWLNVFCLTGGKFGLKVNIVLGWAVWVVQSVLCILLIYELTDSLQWRGQSVQSVWPLDCLPTQSIITIITGQDNPT